MATFISYNGVSLGYLLSEDWTNENVYDPTGVDYLYIKRHLRVKSLLNPAVIPAIAGETDPAMIEKRLRACLMCPRKKLICKIGDTTELESPAPLDKIDHNNGPHPISFNVLAWHDIQTAIVEFQIDTYLRECCAPTTAGGVGGTVLQIHTSMLSNRWSEEVSFDTEFHSTRTRRGVAIFSTAQLPNPDDFRAALIPDTLKGFVRKSYNFVVDQENNKIAYEFVDEEMDHIPPKPATRIKLVHDVTTNKGAIHWQTISIGLWAPKGSKKKDMIALAAQMALAHMGPGIKGKTIVEQASISHEFPNNYVELKMRAMVTATTQNTGGMNALFNNPYLDKLFGEDPKQTPIDPGTRGTALYHVVLAALNDICTNCQYSPNQPNPNAAQPAFPGPAQIPAKNVVIAQLPPGANNIPINLAPLQTRVITKDQKDVNYVKDDHTLALTSASAKTTTQAVVALASPTYRKIVDWVVESIGGKAPIPSPKSNDPNEVFSESQSEFAETTPHTSGDFIHRVQGRYIYDVIDASKVKLTAPKPVYSSGSRFTYTDKDMVQGLINK